VNLKTPVSPWDKEDHSLLLDHLRPHLPHHPDQSLDKRVKHDSFNTNWLPSQRTSDYSLFYSCVRCQWFQSNNTESLFAGDSEHLEIWAEHPRFKGFNLVKDKIKPVISTTWPWKNKTVIYLTQVSVDLAAQYYSTHWGKCKSTRTQTKIWFSVRSENQAT